MSTLAPAPIRIPQPVRPEIQALRALAVGVVVLYHLWPGSLKGGFVGVDVFFAISGFLITAHLLREAVSTGRVSLPKFWARRARRLLPASLLVLLVSGIATLLWVPQAHWVQFFREIAASALYVQNWELATNAVDYLAADNNPSPVQHYWSLSAEEQFYIVWPILILVALLFAAKRSANAKRIAIGIVLGIVVAASFVFSVWETSTNPAQAYFITPTRAWEFGLGGLLAIFAGGVAKAPHAVRALVSWLGLAAIVLAVLTYSGETPFPGYQAALPVLGTLAVIWAGAPDARWSPSSLASIRPIQWLGDVSYSVYLWHWPLIVIVPFALDRELGTVTKVGILLVTLVLAWASKKYVEDPAREGRFLVTRKPRWTFAAMAAGMVIVVGLGASVVVVQQTEAAQAQAAVDVVLAEAPECFGAPAATIADPAVCEEFDLGGKVIPSQSTFSSERPEIYSEECQTTATESAVKDCVFGNEKSETVIALAGDSHAAQWFPALKAIAETNDLALHVFFKSGCPFLDNSTGDGACAKWNNAALDEIEAIPGLDTVVTSSTAAYNTDYTAEKAAARTKAFTNRWNELQADGLGVLVIADTPRMNSHIIDCLEQSTDAEVRDCGLPRSESLYRTDVMAEAAAATPGVELADFSEVLCTTDWCPAVIGDVIAYRDNSSHLTATFSRTFETLLWPKLQPLL